MIINDMRTEIVLLIYWDPNKSILRCYQALFNKGENHVQVWRTAWSVSVGLCCEGPLERLRMTEDDNDWKMTRAIYQQLYDQWCTVKRDVYKLRTEDWDEEEGRKGE